MELILVLAATLAWLLSLFVALALVPNLARRRWTEWATSPSGDAVLGDIISRMMEPTRSSIIGEVHGVAKTLPATFEKMVDRKLYQSAGQLAKSAKTGKAATPEEASVLAVEGFLQSMGVKYPSPILVMRTLQSASNLLEKGDLPGVLTQLKGHVAPEGTDVLPPLARP
jgi:hypothetical protein